MSLVNTSSQAMYSGAETVPFLGIGKDLKCNLSKYIKKLMICSEKEKVDNTIVVGRRSTYKNLTNKANRKYVILCYDHKAQSVCRH